MIPLLAPLFQGDWAPLGETLACAPQWPTDAIPVSRLVSDGPLLGEVIRRHATHLGVTGGDLRAAASTWSLAYLWALLPPVVAAASVLQHRFPMRAEDVALRLDAAGRPTCFHIVQEDQALPGTPTATRYEPLLMAHLAPLFLAIGAQTRLTQKILWGNAARYLEIIFGQALALTGHAAHVEADRQTLLELPTWPDGRPNPLHSRQRASISIEHGEAMPITLHRQCCLSYLLPGQNYCAACPLSPEHGQSTAISGPQHDATEARSAHDILLLERET